MRLTLLAPRAAAAIVSDRQLLGENSIRHYA